MKRKYFLAFFSVFMFMTSVIFGALTQDVVEGYERDIEKYMDDFVDVYSNDAVNETSVMNIDSVEDEDGNLTITRYTNGDKGVVRYKFEYTADTGKRTIDYYLISNGSMLISDLSQVNSSEFLSTTMNDILYSNVRKYLVMEKNKLIAYVPDLKITVTVQNPGFIFTDRDELRDKFESLKK